MSSSSSSVSGVGGGAYVPIKPSLLPPLSSFTVSNALALARLLIEPILFLATLPLLIAVGIVKFYFFGGRAKNRQMADSLPSLVAKRLERMTKEANLPRSDAVTTSTRSAPAKGPRGFASQFIDNGDVNLHVVTGGDWSSSKPILLFVHGFPETFTTWESQLIFFAKQGYPVAAMDMRGYGLSTAPAEVSSYTLPTPVSDVLKVIHKLRLQAPEHDVVLCGHDWGGIVSWRVAMTQRSEDARAITKLVIASAPHPEGFNEYAIFKDRFQIIRSWYIAFFNIPWLPDFYVYSDPVRFAKGLSSSDQEMMRATFADPATCNGMLGYYRSLVRDILLNRLPKGIPIQIPVLTLWGERDSALGAGLPRELDRARWTPNPKTRTTVLDATHWIMHDRPREVNEQILRFLQDF